MNAEAEPINRAVAHASPVLRLFFVEDSPVILDLLVTTLHEMLDIEILGTAADEASVVKWMQGPDVKSADVLVVDLILAQGSGLSVLQAANDLDIECRRVVLTNYATPVIRERCEQLGASKVFDKSTELDELVRFLGDLCTTVRG
jgi:DNA-binding NarL/FixJ family response regulator